MTELFNRRASEIELDEIRLHAIGDNIFAAESFRSRPTGNLSADDGGRFLAERWRPSRHPRPSPWRAILVIAAMFAVAWLAGAVLP